MIITSIVLFLIIFLCDIDRLSKKQYCIIIGLILFLVLAFRDISLGSTDTEHYVQSFIYFSDKDFSYINQNAGKDQLFFIAGRLFAYITDDYRLWLAFMSACLIIVVTVFIYKYSPLPRISFLMFYVLGYYAFAFSILRQAFSLVFVLIAIIYLIKQEKHSMKALLIFTGLVVFASLFHAVAIVSILMYPTRFFKCDWKSIVLIVVFFVISNITPKSISDFLSTYFTDDRFAHYSVGEQAQISFQGYLVNLAFFVFVYIAAKYMRKKCKYTDFILWNMAIGCSVRFMAVVVAEFMRLAMFFNIVQIIGVSWAIISILNPPILLNGETYKSNIFYEKNELILKRNQTSLVYYVIMMCLILYFFIESSIFQMNYFMFF